MAKAPRINLRVPVGTRDRVVALLPYVDEKEKDQCATRTMVTPSDVLRVALTLGLRILEGRDTEWRHLQSPPQPRKHRELTTRRVGGDWDGK